jgi:AraC family transcriptional regulator
MTDVLHEEYAGRVNRVLDYVDAHLDEELGLELLARVAAFSPYHFHRLFSALIGEPLGGYIRRVRLEQAASRLENNPRASITEVALDHGFSSPATFARAFKAHFGVAASEWRGERLSCRAREPDGSEGSGAQNRQDRKDRKAIRKESEAGAGGEAYDGLETAQGAPRTTSRIMMQIEVKQLPQRRVAYTRALGPYEQSAERAWGELCQWAGPRGFLGPKAVMLGISHGDPTITEPGKLRYDACLEVGAEVMGERNVTIATVAGGDYAVARFEGRSPDIAKAYDEIYGRWLPESGYQPGDAPGYELYLKDPADGVFLMDICVPVKPL